MSVNKRALVLIATLCEEMEIVTPIDVLRRAGVEVTVAGLFDTQPVECSRQVLVVPETTLAQAIASGTFDAIILPGGRTGANAFVDSEEVGKVLKAQDEAGRILAAICAAPKAFKKYGVGLGKSLTSYPTSREVLEENGLYTYKDERVVVDGNLITSRGPGTALEWSLAIAEALVGKEQADEVAKQMLFNRN